MGDGAPSQEQLEATLEKFNALLTKAKKGVEAKYDQNLKDSFQEKWEDTKGYVSDHPLLTTCVLVMIAMCSVPVMCFVAFAIGSIFITFMGFMFLEGILLTFGTAVLGIVLCIVGFFSCITCACIVAAWFSFSGSKRLAGYFKEKYEAKYGQKRGDKEEVTTLMSSHERDNKEEYDD